LPVQGHDARRGTEAPAVNREFLLGRVERRRCDGELLIRRRGLPLRVHGTSRRSNEHECKHRQIGDANHPFLLRGAVDRSSTLQLAAVNQKHSESRYDTEHYRKVRGNSHEIVM
jgi:hypothetical protein